MSKIPEQLAGEWASKQTYIITINDTTTTIAKEAFLAGYKAAQAIVEEELQAVQAQRVKRPGLGSAEYALKNVLTNMGSK